MLVSDWLWGRLPLGWFNPTRPQNWMSCRSFSFRIALLRDSSNFFSIVESSRRQLVEIKSCSMPLFFFHWLVSFFWFLSHFLLLSERIGWSRDLLVLLPGERVGGLTRGGAWVRGPVGVGSIVGRLLGSPVQRSGRLRSMIGRVPGVDSVTIFAVFKFDLFLLKIKQRFRFRRNLSLWSLLKNY